MVLLHQLLQRALAAVRLDVRRVELQRDVAVLHGAREVHDLGAGCSAVAVVHRVRRVTLDRLGVVRDGLHEVAAPVRTDTRANDRCSHHNAVSELRRATNVVMLVMVVVVILAMVVVVMLVVAAEEENIVAAMEGGG